MKEFTLNPEFITDVPYTITYNFKKNCNESVAEFYNRLLRWKFTPITVIGRKEHPKFTELREEMEKTKYIGIERRWSNGDLVLKTFKLNGELFKKRDQFPCAAALKFRLSASL